MAEASLATLAAAGCGRQIAGRRDPRHLRPYGAEAHAGCGGRPSAVSVGPALVGVAAVAYQIAVGIGTWGLNRTVGWAFDITNFVFWIGIGHAGTLISAILLLFRQKWRTSVNRSAEAMTIFAVICAACFR